MKMFRGLFSVLIVFLFISGVLSCFGSEGHVRAGAKPRQDLTDQDLYLITVLQHIANYSRPGMGVDEKTGLPLDHVRVDPESNITWGRGMYTAASKVAPYLLFLLKVYQGEGYYAHIHLIPTESELSVLERMSAPPNNQTLAIARMQRALDTIEDMISRDEQAGIKLGGMMAWASIYPDGTVRRDKDLVPLLDNGLLSWAYAAILGALEEEKWPMAQNLRTKVQKLLDQQDYSLFHDPDRAQFFGEIDVKTGKGNPGYYLEQMWTEDLLAVMWALLKTPMSSEDRLKAWDRLKCNIAEWTTSGGEVIDLPVGYIGSNHEILWTLALLPVRQTPLFPLFYNSQFAHADFAAQNRIPGFLSTGYDSVGAYMKMGLPAMAEHPESIQRTDCAVVFATAGGMIADPVTTRDWLYKLIKEQHLLSDYGPLEAVGPGGRADILSADAQYMTALLLGGGVGRDVTKYLAANKVAAGEATCLSAFSGLMQRSQLSILARLKIEQLRIPKQPFPAPPKRDYASEPVQYAPQPATFDIMANLVEGTGDRHGAGVFSALGRNMRWEVADGIMSVNYEIPPTADDYTRFAWWGTYLGTNRPFIAAFTHLRITVPNDGKRHRFNIMLKREDTTIVQPIPLDTRQPGVVSDDDQWKTYTFPLRHRRRFARLPLTYIAFSVDDPVRNTEFPSSDSVTIKSLVLFNDRKPDDSVNVGEAIEAIGRLPAFTPRPDRPVPLSGSVLPRFIASGSIGGSIEDISRETDGALYFEFDSVDTSNGFSGVWGRFEDLDLKNCKYLVFDAITGPAGPSPNLLRVECKTTEGLTEILQCAWNLNMATPQTDVSRSKWTRFVLPMPRLLSPKPAQMLAFVYENYMGGMDAGSMEISSPAFVLSDPTTFAESGQFVVQLSPAIEPRQTVSLMPWWQVAKGDVSRDVTNSIAANGSFVELSGNGGWFGARLYPSFMAFALGNTLKVEIEPVSDEPCTGMIEIKGGRTPHVKTKKFTVTKNDVPAGARTATVEFPMFFRSPQDNVDYIAISGIRGQYRIHSIQTSLKENPSP